MSIDRAARGGMLTVRTVQRCGFLCDLSARFVRELFVNRLRPPRAVWLLALFFAGLLGVTSLAWGQFGSKTGDVVGTVGGACNSSINTYGWPDVNGDILKCVSNVWTLVTQPATAGGSNGQVQFNSSGVLAGSTNLFWNNSSGYLGIGTATPANTLDVNGAVAVGTYAGTTAPSNGLIVSGQVGIGTTTPYDMLEVAGGIRATPNYNANSTNGSVSTTLNGAITSSQTSITVVSTAGFPASGRLAIASEVVSYTGLTSTTFTGLVRGLDGTTASAHGSGSVVNYFVISSGIYSNVGPNFFVTSGGMLSLGQPQYAARSQANQGGVGLMVGYNTNAGQAAIAVGNSAAATGNYSIAVGSGATASGSDAQAFGLNATASGSYTFAAGIVTTAAAYDDFAIGRYNVGGGTAGSWVATDPLFEIGNGVGTGTQVANAFTVLKNGDVGIGSSSPQATLDVNGAIDITGLNGVSYPSADTTAGGTIAIGPQALANIPASAAYGDVAIGYQTLSSASMTTAATHNVGIGYQALKVNTTSSENTAVGYLAFTANTTGGGAAFGGWALKANTSGNDNVAMGWKSLFANTTGSDNVAVGDQALGNNVSASNSSAFGFRALLSATGSYNTGIGYYAGEAITTGINNTVLGSSVASTTLTTGSDNILIGNDATTDTFSASTSNAVAIGFGAKAGSGDIAIGYQAYHTPVLDSAHNIAIGYQTLASASMTTAATNNTAVGYQALTANTSGYGNTAFGTSALTSVTAGFGNTAVGTGALRTYNSNAATAVGNGALSVGGFGGTAVGYAALIYNTGAFNVAIGDEAGYGVNGSSTGQKLVLIGYQAGENITTGSNNTILGYNVASTTITTESGNILIGVNAGGSAGGADIRAAGTNNFLDIGNAIFATGMTGTLTSPAGLVGIGTATMASTFEVNGNASIGYPDTAATSNGLIVSGNVGIGTNAPAYLLHVGSASASGIVQELQNSSGACTFTPSSSSLTTICSSDQRLKEDIEDAPAALPQLADMRVRTYTIKADGTRKTGVIAQEMLWKHPDMVHMGPEGMYGVEAPNVWMLVKAIQELKAANDDLTDSLKAANDNIADLRERLKAREGR